MATLSITTNFDLALTTKQFKFHDSTDYAGQGITASQVTGAFQILDPNGNVVYDNLANWNNSSADILVASSRNNVTTIAANLNVVPIIQGIYTITYQIYVNDHITNPSFEQTFLYDYKYQSPTVQITATVDCLSPLLTEKDVTDYTAGGINPVPSSFSRVNTLYYPNAADGTPRTPTVSTTTSPTVDTIAVSLFYQGTQQASVVTNLVYTIPAPLDNSTLTYIVTDLVNGGLQIPVDCTNLCSLICGISNLLARINQCCATDEDTQAFCYVMALVGFINMNVYCGTGSPIDGYIQKIKDLIPMGDNCTSCGEAGSPIVGIGTILNNIVVTNADSSIVVTTNTVGTLTTYYVKVNPTIVTNVNALVVEMATVNLEIAALQVDVAALVAAAFTLTSADTSVIITKGYTAVSAILINAGTGYTATDVIHAIGGTESSFLEITIDTIGAGGSIATFHVSSGGAYTVKPSNPVSTHYSGAGLNATFDVEWSEIDDLSVSLLNASAFKGDVSAIAESTTTILPNVAICPKTGDYYVLFNFDYGVSTAPSVSYAFPVKNGIATNISANGITDQINIGISNGDVKTYSATMPLSTISEGDTIGICIYKTEAHAGVVYHYNVTLIKVK